MSDDNGKTVELESATGTNLTEEPQDDTLGESGKKALANERDGRKAAEKALREAQDKLKSIESAQLSDLEKAQAAATDWQQKAEAATAESLRYRIAAKHGIAEEDAETFLTGTDEDTLTRQAERLQALAKPSGTPRPDPTQGAKGTNVKATAAQQFADTFAGRI